MCIFGGMYCASLVINVHFRSVKPLDTHEDIGALFVDNKTALPHKAPHLIQVYQLSIVHNLNIYAGGFSFITMFCL